MIDRDNVPNVQVSIVQKLDNAIFIQWIMLLVSLLNTHPLESNLSVR